MLQKLQNNRCLLISLAVLVCIIIQVLLISIDRNDSPHKAAVEFAKAYYQLNPSMGDRLCSTSQFMNGLDVVNERIQQKRIAAEDLGFGLNYMKYRLYGIDTKILEPIEENDTKIKIELKGHTRRSIHTIYSIIGSLPMLKLVKTHKVETTLDLVKEDGKWKVCGNPFSLPEA